MLWVSVDMSSGESRLNQYSAKNTSHVSPCYAYRGKRDGETDADFVARLAAELDAEFQRVGPENVCAFIAEPVVGAVCYF